MDGRVVAQAPAKINLHLEILRRRPDGFHDILSLFQALSLQDSLSARAVPGGEIRLSGDFDCPAAENTVFRAARTFLRAAGRKEGLEIEVDKRIPAGAGLGGGSSDAAASLSALNLLFGSPFTVPELAALGASVGSDVPFFFQGPCAAVSGRGEAVRRIPGRADYRVVVLFPGFPTGTSAAYAAVDAAREKGAGSWTRGDGSSRGENWLLAEYRKPPGTWAFRNDFYEALYPGRPELVEAREALREAGADFVSLTGSGSAFFGVFKTPEAARLASDRLNGREGRSGKWLSIAAAPLARMPLPRLK